MESRQDQAMLITSTDAGCSIPLNVNFVKISIPLQMLTELTSKGTGTAHESRSVQHHRATFGSGYRRLLFRAASQTLRYETVRMV